MSKRLRMQMLGTGKVGDAYRVALPTYTLVDPDTGAMTAVVDVPDECYPPAPVGKPETVTNSAKNGNVITAITLEHAIDAAQFFDKKYAERVGAFGLDVK